MLRNQALLSVLAMLPLISPANTGATERPGWAQKVPVYGVLLAAQELPGDVPGLAEGSRRFAAQDGKGRIYLLSTATRDVAVFRPDGRAWDSFVLPPGREPARNIDAFAVDARGDVFAVLDGIHVHLLGRNHALAEVTLPFVGTDLAFDRGELLVSRVPARMVRRGHTSRLEADLDVVLRFTSDGEPDGVAWRAAEIEGPNAGLAAMTNLFLIASGRSHALWIGRRSGTMLLSRVSRGRVNRSWHDDTIGVPPTFPGSAPTSIEDEMKSFTKDAQAKAQYWHAPVTIRDLVVHDDLAWVLLRGGVLGEDPVVAVYDRDRDGPLALLALGGHVADFADLAVTDDGLWVIPRMGNEPICYFERIPDPIILEMARRWDRRHGGESVGEPEHDER